MVHVRLVVASDEAAWRKLFLDYVVFYKASVPEVIVGQTWRRLLNRDDNMMALIAVDDDGKAVGIANVVFHRSTWSATWYCYLEDLFVAPEARGLGAGRALIEATYVEADRRGATRTYWATQEGNTTARKLYDRVGTLTEFVQYRR
jgi:GNAT superfamily N-acetyltransferase